MLSRSEKRPLNSEDTNPIMNPSERNLTMKAMNPIYYEDYEDETEALAESPKTVSSYEGQNNI